MSRGSTITTEVDIWVSDVLDELSDQDLMEEIANRKLGSAGSNIADTLREWRDALERGDNPMRVAASIRAFMFNELPPVTIEMPEQARRLSS